MSIRAAIDIGSNSIKLLVLELDGAGGYRIVWNESRVTRLGLGIDRGGRLNSQSKLDSMVCLAEYIERCLKLGAASIRTAGTSALREAEDAGEFTARIHEQLGLEVEVISGADEARLSRVVALRELRAIGSDVVFFDVGGNSTEVTWCREGVVQGESSLALGARRCATSAEVRHPVSPAARDRLLAMIHNPLYAVPMPSGLAAGSAGDGATQLAGLGGTATTLAWLLQGLRGEGISDPHLGVVALADIDSLLHILQHRSASEVRGMANLDSQRADVVFAGITIIAEIMRHYHSSDFVLVDRGLRFGLLLD